MVTTVEIRECPKKEKFHYNSVMFSSSVPPPVYVLGMSLDSLFTPPSYISDFPDSLTDFFFFPLKK